MVSDDGPDGYLTRIVSAFLFLIFLIRDVYSTLVTDMEANGVIFFNSKQKFRTSGNCVLERALLRTYIKLFIAEWENHGITRELRNY